MRLRKIDNRGFSHIIVGVAFAVIFAIGGVVYLVASHADPVGPREPLYRLYSPTLRDHFYTTNASERQMQSTI